MSDVVPIEMSYRQFNLRKRNGSFRRICAPNETLVAYQRSKLPALYDLFDNVVEEEGLQGIFHGFIPDRNCVTSGMQHIGYMTTIMMDIADFFDSVTNTMLADFDLTTAKDDHLYHKDGSCAQGFATSPILANIAITKVIKRVKRALETILSENSFALTIYADDLSISINTESKPIIDMIKVIVGDAFEEFGFKIKPSKTRVRFAKYGRRHMLGIAVGDTDVQVPRKTKRKLRAARHQQRWSSVGGLTTWSRCLLPKALRDIPNG